jgi:hypothetical protein
MIVGCRIFILITLKQLWKENLSSRVFGQSIQLSFLCETNNYSIMLTVECRLLVKVNFTIKHNFFYEDDSQVDTISI